MSRDHALAVTVTLAALLHSLLVLPVARSFGCSRWHSVFPFFSGLGLFLSLLAIFLIATDDTKKDSKAMTWAALASLLIVLVFVGPLHPMCM